MSREQIEEMARIIGHCESTLHPDIECHNKATGCYCIENPCHNQRIAEKLYNAGYRKQSEVAREIFEEIYKLLFSSFTAVMPCNSRLVSLNELAELKKKYTESEV